MKDYENLSPQAAWMVKRETDLALRHYQNGKVEEAFNVLSLLNLNAQRALKAADPQNRMQLPLFD